VKPGRLKKKKRLRGKRGPKSKGGAYVTILLLAPEREGKKKKISKERENHHPNCGEGPRNNHNICHSHHGKKWVRPIRTRRRKGEKKRGEGEALSKPGKTGKAA